MLTLQENFRQLALDMNAVTSDDPNLSEFNVTVGKAPVDVYFRDYKKELSIRARVYREGSPQFRIVRRGPIDRLGQRLGIDARQVLADADFNVRYELEIFEDEHVDPLSARDAVASLFADDAAREAVRVLDKDGSLPVSVSPSGVEWETGSASRRDLGVARVTKLCAGVALLAQSLPGARVSAPSTAPLTGAGGRKLIRRVKGESWAHKVFASLDLWPMYFLIGGAGITGVWTEGDTHYLDHRLWLPALLFGGLALVKLSAFILILRGTTNALAYALWRALGAASVVALVVYFAAYIYDSEADTARVATESATVVSVQPAFGPIPGKSTLRTARGETLRVLSDDFGAAGAVTKIDVHPGRLGWRWIEKRR